MNNVYPPLPNQPQKEEQELLMPPEQILENTENLETSVNNPIFVPPSERKTKKIDKKINILQINLNEIQSLLSVETDAKRIKALRKKEERLQECIASNQLKLVSKKQHSLVDRLRLKNKTFRICIISLLALILLTIGGAATWLYLSYSSFQKLQNNYFDECRRTDELESQIFSLESKAEWFDSTCKIVIADPGNLYKTYHTYDCDKWRDHSLWVYNKEQVINSSEYKKCYDCN